MPRSGAWAWGRNQWDRGHALEHVHRTALALALHSVSAPWILWNLRSPAAAEAEEKG